MRLAGELSPDVVLMDLSMPVVDGFEASRRIRLEAPATAVVVLTGSSYAEGFAQTSTIRHVVTHLRRALGSTGIKLSQSSAMAPSSSTARVTYSRLWLPMQLISALANVACYEIALPR